MRSVRRTVGVPLCSRVAHTGLIVPGLGGWSAGYLLLFKTQRVMTRAVKASPAARPLENEVDGVPGTRC